MIKIRPVSDLRNKFNEIETMVQEGEPVYLTKNGYGSMVVMSIEEYSRITDMIEMKLDEAEIQSKLTSERLTHEEVFTSARSILNDK